MQVVRQELNVHCSKL